MAGAAMVFPNNELSLLFPPVTLKLKVLVPILIVLELYLGFSGMNTGIGHFAHLGGALFGALIVLYWRKFDGRW
jgi:membrane associated rhomboid family serine protease